MEKHHACLNTKAIIEYFQEHFPALVPALLTDLHPEIDLLDNPQEFLCDINNWVSSEVVVRLFDRARKLSGDPEIAFKIGQFAVTQQRFGYVQQILTRALATPRRALMRLQALSDKFNRNKTLEVIFLGRRQAILRFRYFRHLSASPDFCLYNKGILTAMKGFWGLPAGALEETRCFFRGDEYCEYHCRWEERGRLRRWLTRIFLPWRLLQETIQELERDKEILRRKYDEVHHLNLQLKDKMQQLLSLPQTCMTALQGNDLKGLVQVSLNFLLKMAKLDRALLFLAREDQDRLDLLGSIGLESDTLRILQTINLNRKDLEAWYQRVSPLGEAYWYPGELLGAELQPLADLFHPRNFLLAPMYGREQKFLGVIYADCRQPEKLAPDPDRDLILNFLQQLSLAIDSSLTQRQLEMSERRYRELVENAYEGIALLDADGVIRFANPRLIEILMTPEPVGQEIRKFFTLESRKILTSMLALNRQGQVAQRELSLRGEGKNQLIVLASSVPVKEDQQYSGSFLILHEVTKLKQMEQRLLQQQKLTAITTLAEGWARSIQEVLNNLLILNSLLLSEVEAASPLFADLKQMEDELQRGWELVERLQSFGRTRFQPRPTDLNLLLEKIVKLCRFTHKHLRFRLELQPGLPPALLDTAQIEPLFLRLLQINKPSPQPQEVLLTTEAVTLTEEFCQPYQRLPGEYLYLSLQLPPGHTGLDTQDLIFTPFVTGLAAGSEQFADLMSIYSIVRNHQGIIEVDTTKEGITIHLYFPVVKEKIPEPRQPVPNFVRGSGTILLVDDDQQVRALGQRLLQRLGYQVIVVAGGREAIDYLKSHPKEVDLVILDLILPDLSGRETFYRLRELDPDLKILIYSAYSLDEEVHQLLEKGAVGFLQKPYRLAVLSQKIASILGQYPSASAGVEQPAPARL